MDLLNNQTTLWWSDATYLNLTTNTWFLSIVASCAVGLSGVVPLIIVPDLKCKDGETGVLSILLSFAVGSLLGDVFLHLLPETWQNINKAGESSCSHTFVGICVLLGIFTFSAVEKMFAVSKAEEEKAKAVETEVKKGCLDANQNVSAAFCVKEHTYQNGFITHRSSKSTKQTAIPKQSKIVENKSKHIAGYLNLAANAVDNFSHGLAVAASFVVGTKMGLLTTAAILIHEIPHEVGDFAILLKSGFSRWEAAKAQFSTATVGVAGALFALSANSLECVGNTTNWILPFTAGGFLNIALVNLLPELMKEKDPWESLKQLIAIFFGIAVMGAVGVLTE